MSYQLRYHYTKYFFGILPNGYCSRQGNNTTICVKAERQSRPDGQGQVQSATFGNFSDNTIGPFGVYGSSAES